MHPTIMLSGIEEAKLHNHLQHTLEDLPNNLPQYNEIQLLGESILADHSHRPGLTMPDDLTFLLRSPLFLYTIRPRLTKCVESSGVEAMSPTLIVEGDSNHDNDFNIFVLDIRVKWDDGSWATQLLYADNILLEGRQHAEHEVGFFQCFIWFCDEASFLTHEFKAREHTIAMRMGLAKDTEALEIADNDAVAVLGMMAVDKRKTSKRLLKLKVRFKTALRGRAGE
jgi:hypothetical protein